MGFLEQLKQQAQVVQAEQGMQVQHLDANVDATEQAGQVLWRYLSELAAQLNIIQPPAPTLSLDGKTTWPDMKLAEFRFDARQKLLRQREVLAHVGLGWRQLPRAVVQSRGRVAVNFPPELERVETRVRAGQVKHERLEQRHPDTHKLLSVVFEHDFATRASVVFTPDHDQAVFNVRLVCVRDWQIQQLRLPVAAITTGQLDELAKAIVGQPSAFG
jgi:hypothetical protein